MLFNRTFLMLLPVMMSVSSVRVSATIIPALDLPALTRQASLIAVGQVVAVREEGRLLVGIQGQSTPVRRMVANLRVDRVLKGPAERSTISFSFLIPEVPLGYGGIAISQFGMFFLRETSQQGYAVLNPYFPFIIASPDAPIAKGSDLDRVVAEVAHVLVSTKTSTEERKRAIDVLDRVDTVETTAILQVAARDLDAMLRLRAAAALLRRNDISTLNMVEDALLHSLPKIPGELLTKLAFALYDGVRDSQAIPALTRLLRAPDVQTRRGAAAALRHTGAEEAIEPLTMALEDSDPRVRYNAVLGLAIITGQSNWGPSIDLFERDEQHYLTYWREWAKTR